MIKSRQLTLVIASGVCVLVGLTLIRSSLAQTAPETPAKAPRDGREPRDHDGAGREPRNVEGAMKRANGALKQLRNSIADDAKRDDNLRLLGEMEHFLIIAKNMPIPDDALESAADETARAAMRTEYRKDMIDVSRMLLDIEKNVLEGKGDAAKGQLDELITMRNTAHERFGVKKLRD